MTYFQKKKHLLFYIVGKIKGFVRTVLGIPPLTLPDCVDEDSIINYTIDGNSIQDGTPTPENPVEVESVGELCTKNLFNKDGFCEYYNSFGHATLKANANDNYLGEDCFSYYMKHPSSNVNEFIWLKGAFKENTQYVISGNFAMDFPGTDSRAGVLMFFKYTDSTTLTPTLTMYKDKFVQSKFVSDEGKTIDYIYIANFSATAKIYIKDFQLEEGTTVTDYEPYGKYKIPVKCSGKNLFDVNRWYEELTAACTHNNKPYFTTIDGLDCIAVHPPGGVGFMKGEFKENTQYTLSCYVKSDKSNYTGLLISYTDGSTSTRLLVGSSWGNRVVTSTVGKTISSIQLYFYGGAYAYYHNIQLEEGTTATDYEPYVEPVTKNIYLDEPLRSLRTYASSKKIMYLDYIDYEKQKVIRQVGVTEFNENYTTYASYAYTNTSFYGFYRYVNDMKKGDRMSGLCTYYNNIGFQGKIWFGAGNTNIVYFSLPDIYNAASTQAERNVLVKEWFASLEEPFMVYYPLAEVTETPITLPKLQTIKGTTVYSIDIEVQPSNMSATYYSTAKE